jgi:hypothetical protein
MRIPRLLFPTSAFATSVWLALPAFAQTAVVPPPDIAQAVKAPAASASEAPKPIAVNVDATDAAVSAGAQYAAGNSKLVAGTALGKFSLRRGENAVAASLVGNYSRAYLVPPLPAGTPLGTPPAPGAWQTSTENLQAKLRYDRFFTSDFSGFVQVTGLHDAFLAITFRLNIDPGVKLLVMNEATTKLWGEAGYDFQFDDNYTNADGIQQAGAGGFAVDAQGFPYVISKTDTIHSTRLYAGFQHAFNKDVQLSLGLEYLQGLGGSGGSLPLIPPGYTSKNADPIEISLTASRLNFDWLLASHLFGGLSVGLGFNLKYNSAPLPGKENVDTAGTASLIYAFSGAKKPEVPTCPCPPPPSPPHS